MNIISFYDIKKYKLIKEIDENKRDIRLYNFKNCTLKGNSINYPDILLKSESYQDLILPIKEMTMSLNKKSFYEENGMYFKDYIKEIDSNNINSDVYFFIYNTENYYHFIYDTLPYLYCYLKLRENNPNLKLLMNYNKNKSKLLQFVKESLELLNIKESDIIIHKENNKYKNIYLSSSLTHNGLSNCPPRKEIFYIYKKMIESAKSKECKIKLNDKIYISRRTWLNSKNDNIGTNYTMRRKLMNEDELVDILEQNDFVEIFGENYTMTEKIQIFNNSKYVIGAIGGTISNCIFCNDSCKVICLVSPDFLNINYRMKFLFNENVKLFQDTYLDCNEGDIPINVRVEIIDKKLECYKRLGEISKKIDDKYQIKLSKNMIGWNENENYDTILLLKNQIKTLDNGINSPWYVNLEKIYIFLN